MTDSTSDRALAATDAATDAVPAGRRAAPPVTAEPPGDRGRGEPYLSLENIGKTFGTFTALRDIYLDVYPGEFVCLLGPSGCGKTTLLRIIAGLELQTLGRTVQDGKDVSRLPAAQRDFGIVFQSYALFPNLTAAQNVAYGLQNAGRPRAEIDRRVTELLDLVGLSGCDRKYPAQLSGGQQQRVALARALALSPGLLLLDEPLSALDAQVRVRLRGEIANLQRRLGITTVMVTHDQAEALAMADRIVVMNRGCIAQVGTPRQIYLSPSTPFVANFIGVMNFLRGEVVARDRVRCGNVVLSVPHNDLPEGSPASVAIRPEDIQIVGYASEGAAEAAGPVNRADNWEAREDNCMTATVAGTEFLGSGYRVSLYPDGNARELVVVEIPIRQARQLDLGPDDSVRLRLAPERIHTFPVENAP